MLVATDVLGDQVLAWRIPLFDEREYFCPECEEAVFVKDGPLKIAHFSHYPSSTCGYGTGESARHVALKMAVMQAFEAFEDVEFERSVVAGRRADVIVPSERVVLECQASTLHSREWLQRTLDYSDAGYSVLWVWDTARFEIGYNAKEILLCHRKSYGQVTACDPETAEWYSVHFDNTNEHGSRVGAAYRPARWKPIPDEAELFKKTNDGLRVVNLMPVWWTSTRTRV